MKTEHQLRLRIQTVTDALQMAQTWHDKQMLNQRLEELLWVLRDENSNN